MTTTPNILPMIQRAGPAGMRIADIMAAADLSPKTAHRLVTLLRAEKRVVSQRTGNTVHYIAAEHYAPKFKPAKNPPGRPRHDIAKIKREGLRSANISPARVAIEKILQQAKSVLQRIARDHGAAHTPAGWVLSSRKPATASQQRPVRVCNGSAPAGDADYWRQHMRAHQAPARAGASAAFEIPSRGVGA